MNSDIEFLGLVEDEEGPGRYTFEVVEHLARPDGQLYGGTAIGVSVAAAELATERTTVWMTTQFVSTIGKGIPVSVHAEVLAGGRRTNQVRVTATSPDGDIVFASLGATAAPRPDGVAGGLETPPDVPRPEEIPEGVEPFRALAGRSKIEIDLPPMPRAGFMLAAELRMASGYTDDAGLCLWARRRDGAPITAAVAAYLADLVPMGVSHGLGVIATGTSLDNTIRIGDFTETEWILLDIRPHFAAGGYGHGTVHVWNRDGALMASASQTASMALFDLDNPPWAASPGA